jgi:lipopolysaccharide transport system permease protein
VSEIIIEPNKSMTRLWQEFWAYREFFCFLAWRDILVRYKQTVIGVLWSILRPFLSILILTVVFGTVAGPPSDTVPYPLLVCAAVLPWEFFNSALGQGSQSLVVNRNLIANVYFPRIILPSATPLLLLAACVSLRGAYWISALNVKYRDFRHLVPFILRFGMYISPVGFSSAMVPGRWRWLDSLNPMVGVIDGFRWALLGGQTDFFWPGSYSLDIGLNPSLAEDAWDIIRSYPLGEIVLGADTDRQSLVSPHRTWGVIHPAEVSWRTEIVT